MALKIGIPKGTRDFSPIEMAKRNYIFDTIKKVYSLYGFQQIETPSMENIDTLLGKYGQEGDKLLFKILNSGDYLKKVTDNELLERDVLKLASKISEKGLRYDLTVPFARYVVMHKEELQLPFKRYQIQPVWRADKPQKGRYREFYQCDADIVGSNSLLNEIELMQIIDTVFEKFNINVCIKINNRKILSGLAEVIGEKDKIVEITTAIDKLEKIGLERVNQELEKSGLSQKAIEKLQPILSMTGSNNDKLNLMNEFLSSSAIGVCGIEETAFILKFIDSLNFVNEVEFDLTLARGLNYYTGAIFEVKAKDVEIGSITGGGRYDNLTGIFGVPNLSGVGISFGADRIYDVLNALELYPKDILGQTKVLFLNFGEKESMFCIRLLKKLREVGISSEIYPDNVKMKKQMNYANSRNIAFVALVGEHEIKENKVSLKNMLSGDQILIPVEELVPHLLKMNCLQNSIG